MPTSLSLLLTDSFCKLAKGASAHLCISQAAQLTSPYVSAYVCLLQSVHEDGSASVTAFWMLSCFVQEPKNRRSLNWHVHRFTSLVIFCCWAPKQGRGMSSKLLGLHCLLHKQLAVYTCSCATCCLILGSVCKSCRILSLRVDARQAEIQEAAFNCISWLGLQSKDATNVPVYEESATPVLDAKATCSCQRLPSGLRALPVLKTVAV